MGRRTKNFEKPCAIASAGMETAHSTLADASRSYLLFLALFPFYLTSRTEPMWRQIQHYLR